MTHGGTTLNLKAEYKCNCIELEIEDSQLLSQVICKLDFSIAIFVYLVAIKFMPYLKFNSN